MVPLHTENISVGLDYRVCFLRRLADMWYMQVSSILHVQPEIGIYYHHLPKEYLGITFDTQYTWWIDIP